MAEIVRRRSWGGVLPLGRHVSISGSRSIHAPSVSIAPSSFQEGQNANPGAEGQGRTGSSYTDNLNLVPAGEIIGRCSRSASKVQQPHSIVWLEQQVIGRIAMRENRPGEDAGAVVVKLAAIRPEDIVIGTMLIVVLENVSCFRRPFDKLPPFKLVQRMTNSAGVVWVRR